MTLTNLTIAAIQDNFGIDVPEIRNRMKRSIEVTIGFSKKKYRRITNVIAVGCDEGEVRIGYFEKKTGDFRIFKGYLFFYQPEYMVIDGKTFKTDSADKVRIALNYLMVVLSLEAYRLYLGERLRKYTGNETRNLLQDRRR